MHLPRVIGRYALHERIASGGMATVYYGRLVGPVGFSRTVAIKQLHPQYSRDPDFVSMFVDEAHLAARIRHPHVVPVLDVVRDGRELYLVMDYVLGAPLSELIASAARERRPFPHAVSTAIVGGCLRGLHAAHETTDDEGRCLGIVHRDVSPANILVGRDGLARVLDFGIAKAAGRAQVTRHGELKGKVGYMAPEQLRTGDVDRRADVYAVGVTLWETLTQKRAFAGDTDDVLALRRRAQAVLPPPSRFHADLTVFDAVVAKALARAPAERFQTAEELADALEACHPPATIREVSRFLAERLGDVLERRARAMAELDQKTTPAAVRAAILEEVGVAIDDTPSISVSTWTDPSLDVLELELGSESDAGTDRGEPTTRELRREPGPDPDTHRMPRGEIGERELGESAPVALLTAARPAEPDAAVASIPVVTPIPTPAPAVTAPPPSAVTANAVAPAAPLVPALTPAEAPQGATPRWAPVVVGPATPRASSRLRPWVFVGGAVAMALGGAVALTVLRAEQEAAPIDHELAPATAESAAPPDPRWAEPAPNATEPERPPAVEPPTPTLVPEPPRPVSPRQGEPKAAAGAGPEASGGQPAASSSPPPDPPNPFDALGGRH